jgi:uroporphyrinogen decarboxylase
MMKSWWKGPVKAEPDFNNLLKVLRREKPARPTLFEFFLNERLHRKVAPEAEEQFLEKQPYYGDRLQMRAFRNAGYDYSNIGGSPFGFPAGERAHVQTQSLNDGAVITDRKSFEQYKWPEPDSFDYGALEVLGKELPGGMKFMISGPCGVLENVIRLVGFDNLCYLMADDPDLTQQIFDAVGSRLVRHYQIAVQYDSVGCVMSNDDWGFKTQPMLSPDDMRRYVVPWHKRIVDVAHKAGKPAILHSCGNLVTLMDDIIDVIGFEGKHSYEDTIMPVEEAYDKYGQRIAIMGGIGLDFLIRSKPEDVYKRSRAMIERTGCKGYALGTGNSVPEYVPDENYFAMIAAAIESR